MPTISFGGLATGIDSNSIVDRLVALEKAPAGALAQRRVAAEKRVSILSDLVSKLDALKTASKAVDTSGELRGLRVTSTGSDLTATTSAAAGPGTWTVKVDQLARAETSRSRLFASGAAGALGDGTVSITIGGGAAVSVAYGAGDSLDDVAARITSTVPGTSATVLDTGNGLRLLVSSSEPGVAHALGFTETGDGLGMAESESARDALVTVGGTQVSRSSNDLTGVIPGVSLRINAVTAPGSDGTVVTIARDAAAPRAAAQALVDAHNTVVKALQGQLTYSGLKRGEDTLFGDSTLQGLQRRLGTVWSSAFGTGVTPADMGISQGRDGTLTLNATAFDAAATAAPDRLEQLFAGAGGLAANLAEAVDAMTTSGTGQLVVKQASIKTRTADIDRQITRIGDAADAMGERLRRQFTQLEAKVSIMQSDLSFLSQLLR